MSGTGCLPVVFFCSVVATKADPGKGERGLTGGVRATVDKHASATPIRTGFLRMKHPKTNAST